MIKTLFLSLSFLFYTYVLLEIINAPITHKEPRSFREYAAIAAISILLIITGYHAFLSVQQFINKDQLEDLGRWVKR